MLLSLAEFIVKILMFIIQNKYIKVIMKYIFIINQYRDINVNTINSRFGQTIVAFFCE